MNNYPTPPNMFPAPPPQGGHWHLPPEPQNALTKKALTQPLRRLSMTAGFCVLAFIGLQFVLGLLLSVFGLWDIYANDPLFQSAFGGIYAIVCVFLPFFAVSVLMDPPRRREALAFGRPYSVSLMLLAVPAGFMFCMAGNFATSALVTLMDSFGVRLTAPESAVPSTPLGMVMFALQIAFIPALIEEYALRGVVMQPLRRYGDGFAIVMSALVFGLMHSNMIQAPFAFIAGITIGYFVIATGTIWTGVLIHFANNMFSVVLSLVSSNTTLDITAPYAAFMTFSFVVGLGCCVAFAFARGRQKLRKPREPLGLGTRSAAYLVTIPMLLALAAILWITKDYVEFGG